MSRVWIATRIVAAVSVALFGGAASAQVNDSMIVSTAWRAEGRPVTREVPGYGRDHITVHPHPEIVASVTHPHNPRHGGCHGERLT